MATDTHSISDPAATSIAFGPFRLFPMQRLLTETGKPVHLGSRAFDILLALLERAGELVSKEDLIARVWPNTFVEPANLAVHVSALRRALRERPGHRYVVNVPGRGYHFVAPITVEKNSPSALAAVAPSLKRNLPAPSSRQVGSAENIDGLEKGPHEARLITIDDLGVVAKRAVAVAVAEHLIGGQHTAVLLVDLKSLKSL